MAGCTSPKFSKELVCEVEGDWGQALQFITYKTQTFPDLGRFGGGRILTAGVYFDGGVFFWRSKWLMDGYAFASDRVYAAGCEAGMYPVNHPRWHCGLASLLKSRWSEYVANRGE
ncbi:MAG: hypothetical protein KZQ94_22500 [Candidatus Thiodiazotropha sp. (ex Troendleina suluensis)]|nr:hypothetical protein [Candidatus Thiodiazotropha sp. (ex Troendleina suluensis)]